LRLVSVVRVRLGVFEGGLEGVEGGGALCGVVVWTPEGIGQEVIIRTIGAIRMNARLCFISWPPFPLGNLS
jgi:hypothetical protein